MARRAGRKAAPARARDPRSPLGRNTPSRSPAHFRRLPSIRDWLLDDAPASVLSPPPPVLPNHCSAPSFSLRSGEPTARVGQPPGSRLNLKKCHPIGPRGCHSPGRTSHVAQTARPGNGSLHDQEGSASQGNFRLSWMSQALEEPPAPPPPPPLPPPPPPSGPQLLKAALEQAGRERQDDVQELLRRRRASFSEHLKWVLFNNPVPSLIQEGPQCGLVALWMAGALLHLPKVLSLEEIVQVALERGYTAQGEMFSAADMARLAEEVFPCRAELLSGGLEGQNRHRLLQHLLAGLPLLIPYDEDSNHEPCLRRGYKAHWAVASGALLGVKGDPQLPGCQEDKDMPGLFHTTTPCAPLPLGAVAETYLLCKQGKSCRYQLWNYQQVQESNAQLTDFSPSRAADGKVYVVPAGGVQGGLCGQAVLLQPSPTHRLSEN
uniref:actin maturation protease n=1 Tax=Euleptes europaea TaxID=460621 RepID=UPI0025425603|nr:actin maturation protease [Euleptes europaea]